MDPHGTTDVHDHDRGLGYDLPRLLGRRRALALIGAGVAGVAAGGVLAACGSDEDPSGETAPTTGDDAAGAPASGSSHTDSSDGGSTAGEIPEETAGPFPGDGSNGPDVLAQSGVVREDITASFGSSSTVAEGVPLTLEMTVLDAATGQARPGSAVYVWHCDREGRYSMYSEGVEGENYLRGVQAAGDDGRVRFTSVFPGAYPGRWPHVHFEVYPDVDAATAASDRLATSQLAFPEDACADAYTAEGYEQSVSTMAGLSLADDGVFGDDSAARQLAAMSGSASAGFTARLDVPV
jgi:protocatechuate 3,4-dioxygenase beta subunit